MANSSGLNGAQINQYLSPYLGDVLGSTEALTTQQNQQAQSGALGTAISSGAFGGDRTGLAAANLQQQEDLAAGNVYSGIANTGYQSALSTAQQEQQLGLAGANQLAEIGQTAYGEGSNTANELAGFGTGAQSAALQGANAQIAAGTVEQQTQQAEDTAQYNQFEQQQSYPFQVDQFLANIAEGTGALSGSTTTTQQPGGFFSDKRLKHDIKRVGKTYDGQPIYSYKMHGDPRTHIGLIAQDVEKKHPAAVGLAAGYKTVDYGAATEDAANRGHFYAGGLVSRRAYAGGGPSIVSPGDLSAILQAQQQMYAPYSNGAGLYGETSSMPHGGAAHVPAPSGGVAHLVTASGGLKQQPTGLQNLSGLMDTASKGNELYDNVRKPKPTQGAYTAPSINSSMPSAAADPSYFSPNSLSSGTSNPGLDPGSRRGGRIHKDDGGDVDATMPAGGTAFAAGGMPYEDDAAGSPYSNSDLDIPDDPNTNTLTTAGPLQKSPTGLQDLMDMTQIARNFSSIAAARGGLIGRRGYAGDGTVDDDANFDGSDTDPNELGKKTTGAAAAASTQTQTPASSTDDSKPHGLAAVKSFWDNNKGYILPAVSGLAAMGTAPTRSLGVALASGLGAAAQSYVPTQEGLANAELTGQEARGAGYNADLQKATNQYAIPLMQRLSQPRTAAAVPNAPARRIDPTASLANQLREQYANVPLTPEEAQQQNSMYNLAAATKNPYWTEAAKAVPKQRQAMTEYNNHLDAQNHYDDAVATWRATKDSNPSLAASAAATADAYQQFTGDEPMIGAGGVQLNKRTKEPYIGTEAQRFSPEAYVKMAEELSQKVDVPAGDPNDPGKTIQLPAYKGKLGFNTLAEAISKVVPPGTPDVPVQASTQPTVSQPAAGTAAQQGAARVAAPAAAPTASAPRPVTQRPAAAPAALPTRPGQATSGAPDPYRDPDFFKPAPKAQLGTTFGSNTISNRKDQDDFRTALREDSEATTKSASTALQYALAAKKILDSRGAPITGFGGEVAAYLSSIPGGLDASNYEEVAKDLGNLAVQAGRGNFPHATQKENDIQFEQLSPGTSHSPKALRDLLNQNIKIEQWTLDTAGRVPDYINKGGTPSDFYKWNNRYFPRDGAVNNGVDTAGTQEGATNTSKSGRPMIYHNGQWKFNDGR